MVFRHLKAKFVLDNILFIMSIMVLFLIGYLSGNTLDNMFVMILLGFVCGGLWRSLFAGEMSSEVLDGKNKEELH